MSNATKSTLVVVGGGNMGAALVGGLLAAATVDPADLSIVEVAEARDAQRVQTRVFTNFKANRR